MSNVIKQKRSGSTVHRHQVDGRTVFTKNYAQNGWRDTRSVINQRTAREAEILARLATLSAIGGSSAKCRLGKQIVIESDPGSARIVTEEVHGANLEDLLIASAPRKQAGSCTRALLLAGRWLKEFQNLATDSKTEVEDSMNPIDLVDYCRQRLEALSDHGSPWITRGRSERILGWLERQSDSFNPSETIPCWSHGDYAPANMIWDDYRLTPIDFATARLDLPLVDLTYLIHRLEMLSIQFPWRNWPLDLWRRAVISGYAGKERLAVRPIYSALMVRHCVCRLLTLARQNSKRVHQRLHDRYVRQRVQKKIEELILEA